MLHTLALVKIKYGCPKHFLEAFFKIAFVHRHFTAKFFDRYWLTDVLNQYFPCLGNFFPIGFIGQEFTIDHINFFVADHAIHAIKQKHLHLCIDVDIFKAICVIVIQ